MSLAQQQIIPLSLAPDYCPDWNVATALREIIANAIDTQHPWEIIDEHEWLYRTIHSKGRIPLSALLMGNSNKDSNAIGRFGEGLKVAALTFVREQHNLTIRQYIGDTCVEKWWFYIGHNETFGHPTLQVERTIYCTYAHEEVTDVWIQIEAPTNEAFNALFYNIDSILVPEEEFKEAAFLECEAFTVSTFKQASECQLYVSGLHIRNMPNMAWSYNFAPSHIELNRDRNHVDVWQLSRKICESFEQAMHTPIAEKLGDLIYLTLTKEKAYEDLNCFVNYPTEFPMLQTHIIQCAMREANGRPMVDSRSVPIAGGYSITSHLGSVIRGGYWASNNAQLFAAKKQDDWYVELAATIERNRSKLRRDVRVEFEKILTKYRK